MGQIKIKFVDFWEGFHPTNNYFARILKKKFDLVFTDKPDFVVHGGFGNSYLKYDCLRISYTGENLRPDFFRSDFNIGFDFNESPNYLRWPIFLVEENPENFVKKGDVSLDIQKRTDRKFCSFIVSNNRAQERIEFFHKLSRYKKVDSAGKVLNNMGYELPYPNNGKLNFMKNYKFNIAFENESYPGYTTEKISESMLAGSIPIYWGNPRINEDFNPGSFINVSDFSSLEQAVEYIKEVDQNDDLYKKILSEPYFKGNTIPQAFKEETLLNFFEHVFSQKGKVKPVAKAYQKYLYYLNKSYKSLRGVASKVKRGIMGL